MASRSILGIDPGLSGGFALWRAGKIVRAWNTPTLTVVRNKKNRRELDCDAILAILDAGGPYARAIIEQQQPYPGLPGTTGGQGVVSTFATGKNYGILLGLLEGTDTAYDVVPPQAWKKNLKLSSNKQLSFDLGNILFPDASHFWKRKKDDGVVEAALLAHYGATIL